MLGAHPTVSASIGSETFRDLRAKQIRSQILGNNVVLASGMITHDEYEVVRSENAVLSAEYAALARE